MAASFSVPSYAAFDPKPKVAADSVDASPAPEVAKNT
jgi:hypothetical protein